MTKVTLKYPGKDATIAYIRKLMRDGKWRIPRDVVNAGESKGMLLEPIGVGHYMGQLEASGYLRCDVYAGQKMWKIRKCVLEATK